MHVWNEQLDSNRTKKLICSTRVNVFFSLVYFVYIIRVQYTHTHIRCTPHISGTCLLFIIKTFVKFMVVHFIYKLRWCIYAIYISQERINLRGKHSYKRKHANWFCLYREQHNFYNCERLLLTTGLKSTDVMSIAPAIAPSDRHDYVCWVEMNASITYKKYIFILMLMLISNK